MSVGLVTTIIMAVTFTLCSYIQHRVYKKSIDTYNKQIVKANMQVDRYRSCVQRKSGEKFGMDDYQMLAARTINYTLSTEQKTMHGVLGLSSEAGEVSGIYQKIYQGKEFDKQSLIKELGDCLWMIAQIATVNDIFMEQIAMRNIEKLQKRYPDGFSVTASETRDESKE